MYMLMLVKEKQHVNTEAATALLSKRNASKFTEEGLLFLGGNRIGVP